MHSEQQIFDYLQQKFGIRFTEQQQAAVQTIDGPVLLLAVPGAGNKISQEIVCGKNFDRGCAGSNLHFKQIFNSFSDWSIFLCF